MAGRPIVTLPEILTAEEVAGILRLRPSSVADMARRGDSPSIKIGRHRRYVRADVLAYVETLRERNGTGRCASR